jgi:dUTP pyrophosphatase
MRNHETIDIAVLLEEGAELPVYSTHGASGADIKAFLREDIVLAPGCTALIPTGVRLAIPYGFEIQVRPRSGLALKHGITVLNTPGTVDADYRGELGIVLINHGKENFVIKPGLRIAQIVLAPVYQATFLKQKELAETVRGNGGYGHTGLN